MGDDSSVDLGILIKTRSDGSGAQEAAAGLDQIAEKTGQAGAAAEKASGQTSELVRDLTGMRGGTRAARELFEVLEGGGHTVQGLAGLMRLLVVTTEGLAPEVAVVANILLAVTAVFAAKAEHAEASKKEDKETGDSASFTAAAIEQAATRMKTAYEEVARARKEIDDSFKNEGQDADEIAHATSEWAKAVEALNTAKLKLAETEALAANQNGPEGERRIKERFDQIRNSTSTRDELQQIEVEKSQKQGEQSEQGRQYQSKQDQRDADQQKIADLNQALAAAQEKLKQLDITPDAKGSYDGAHKAADEEMKKAAHALEIEYDARDNDDPHAHREAFHQGRIDEAQAKLNEAAERVRAIGELVRAKEEHDNKDAGVTKLQENIDKANADLENLHREQQKLAAELERYPFKEREIITKSQTQSIEDTQKSAAADVKDAYDKRQAQREADRDKLNAELGDKGLTPEQQEALRKKISNSEVEGYQDDLKTNSNTLSEADKIKLQGKIGSAGEKEKSDEHNAQIAALKRQVDELKKQIEARPDHASLEPYVKAIENMADPVKEIPRLQQLMAQTMGAFVTRVDAKTDKLEQEAAKARAEIVDLQARVKNGNSH